MTTLMRREIDSSSSNSTSTSTSNDANSLTSSSTTEDGSAEGTTTPTETNNTTTEEVMPTATTSADQITTTEDATPNLTTAITTPEPAETTTTDDSPALTTITAAVTNNITPGTYTSFTEAAAATTTENPIPTPLSTTTTTQDLQPVQSPTNMISFSTTSSSSQPIFTSSLCGSNNLCVADPIVTTTSNNDNSAIASNISIVQIAGIVIGVVFFLVLVGACLLIRRKRRNVQKNGLNYSSRRVSPFLYLHDEDQEKGTDEGKSIHNNISGFGSDSTYNNHRPSKPNSSGSLGEEDHIFYRNNADYHRGSLHMSNSSIINEKISTPAESYSNRNTKDMMAAATSLYPHVKRIDNNPYYHLNSTSFTIVDSNDDKEVSLDTDNYTLSAMQIFRSSSTATTNTRTRINSYISNTSSSNHGSLPRKKKIYRPSLHDSMFLGSTTSSSSRHNSHHQRQESSLDPHI